MWAALATTPPIKTKTGYIKNQNEAKRLKVKGVVVVPRYHFINRKPKKKKKNCWKLEPPCDVVALTHCCPPKRNHKMRQESPLKSPLIT